MKNIENPVFAMVFVVYSSPISPQFENEQNPHSLWLCGFFYFQGLKYSNCAILPNQKDKKD